MLQTLGWLGLSWSTTEVIFGWLDRYCMIAILCHVNNFSREKSQSVHQLFTASCRPYHCSIGLPLDYH